MKSIFTLSVLFLLNVGFCQQSDKLVNELRSLLKINDNLNLENTDIWEGKFDQSYSSLSASQRCLIHYGFAKAYKINGNYLKAFEHVNKSIHIAERIKSDIFNSDGYFLQGSIEYDIQEYDQSLSSFEKSLFFFQEIGDTAMSCATLNMIGGCYILLGQLDKGRQYYQKAIELSEYTNNDKLKNFLKSNLIAYYLTIKLPDSAKVLMDEVIEFDRNLSNNTNLAYAYGNMAYIYTLKDQYEIAIAYYDSSFTIAYEKQLLTTLMNLHLDRSDLHQQQGEFLKSNQDLRKYFAYKDTISKQVSSSELIDWKIAISSIEKERSLNEEKLKVVELSHQNERQKLRNRLIISSLIGMIIIIILIYLRYRARAIKRKELLEHRLKIEKVEAELRASQLENQELINEQLNQKLDFKNHDLTSLSIDIGRRNKSLSEILMSVKSLEVTDTAESIAKKREIISHIIQQKSINENKSSLQQNIDTVNQEFILKLTSKFEGLTSSDIQLCSLIRIGLNIKEIAAIKSISPKSIEMSRYRLRKKLGLNQGDDMTHLLMNL